MQTKGKFIVIEGLEGAGKSTALEMVRHFLEQHQIQVITTREPGGTYVGEVVRQLIKTSEVAEPLDARAELLLFYAARIQLIEHVIRPALEGGSWVVADRFELSTFAYQGGGRQLDETVLKQLSTFAVKNFKPDLVIFLDILPQQGLARVLQRGKFDRIEQETSVFFKNVYNAYHKYLETMEHIVKIDAGAPLAQVHNQLHLIMKNYLAEHAITSVN